MFQTEYEFELPMGYLDDSGTLHRHGTMRLATAGDEILPLKDPRCQANEAYLIVILLSRVVTRLGSVTVTPKIIEGLFRADLAHLQTLYNRINLVGRSTVAARCPRCEHTFEVGLDDGGIVGYPLKALHEEVAFVSYHFHWPRAEVLALEHAERRRWVEEISAIHRRMNDEAGRPGPTPLGPY